MDYSFHDSNIVALSPTGNDILLVMDGVWTTSGTAEASVLITSVSSLKVEGLPTPLGHLRMLEEDGEMLAFQNLGRSVDMLIEWNDFTRKRSSTRAYTIACKAVHITLMRPPER